MRRKIKVSRSNTVKRVKATFAAFCSLRSEKRNKENHYGGFKQQSPQRLVDRYKHMNRRHNGMILQYQLKYRSMIIGKLLALSSFWKILSQ